MGGIANLEVAQSMHAARGDVTLAWRAQDVAHVDQFNSYSKMADSISPQEYLLTVWSCRVSVMFPFLIRHICL